MTIRTQHARRRHARPRCSWLRRQPGGRVGRGFLCLCALAEAALASLPSPAVAFGPAYLAWADCPGNPSFPVGVDSAYRLTHPTVLHIELPDECLFTNGPMPGVWLAPPPPGRAPMAAPARASGPLWGVVSELRLGVLSHDMAFTGRVGLTFPNPFRHRYERSVNVSGEVIFVSPASFRYIGSPRPRVGASVNLAGYTDDVYADLDWGHAFRAGPFTEAFLGGAWHDGALRRANPRRSELGARFLFHIGLEAGWRLRGHQGVSVIWEHLSNSSFARPNQGLDRFGIRYGYRFD
jgi:lipid A 3-O-deacylase